jgi:chorismate synthase
MSGSTFGRLFSITTWGESHGPAVGVVVDGCPPNIPLDEAAVQSLLDRRRPGRSAASTKRKEADQARICSGIFEGRTTGTPILIRIENKDADSSAYEPYKNLYRPGHGDYTYQAKYGMRDWRGGGRASARETAARVAGAAVAKAFLSPLGIDVLSFTRRLGDVEISTFDRHAIEQNLYLCPDPQAAEKMEEQVEQTRRAGDSLGGVVEIRARGVPAGLGEPVFDKLDADLAKALMSIGAVKGVEVGSGFAAAGRRGSEQNDPILPEGFASNHAGGILAGISNGEEVVVRAAVKPIPSIAVPQDTVDLAGKPVEVSVKGRHDVSAIPRINVVCEAMMWLVLADHFLRQKAVRGLERID